MGCSYRGSYYYAKSFEGRLIKYLELSPNREELELYNVKFNKRDMENIIKCKSIKSLKFDEVNPGARQYNHNLQNENIHTLEISHTMMKSEQMWSLFACLPKVKHLILKRPFMLLQNFHISLRKNIKPKYQDSLKSLTHLTIDFDNYLSTNEVLMELGKNYHNKLEYLSLSIGKFSNKTLFYLGQFRNLKTLKLRFLQESDDFFNWPRIPTLLTLHICEWSFNDFFALGDYSINLMILTLPELQELKLEFGTWNNPKYIKALTGESFNMIRDRGL